MGEIFFFLRSTQKQSICHKLAWWFCAFKYIRAESATFYVKGQVIHIFNSAGQLVTISASQLCHCEVRGATNNT